MCSNRLLFEVVIKARIIANTFMDLPTSIYVDL